jgi:hypothetical protein
MKTLAIAAACLAISFAALGQSETWKDQDGRPLPNTEARKSLNGLGGWLLVTSDADWQEKWGTPEQTVPHFTEALTVGRGKTVFVLAFFTNPKANSQGRADLTCDLDVTRPNGTTSIHQDDVVCFRGALKGSPTSMYLSAPVIGFTGEAADPAGTWTVRITLKDNVRNTVLPLKASFVLE